MDYEPCTQAKAALPAQLYLVQAQQHENILCFGALVEISLMKDTLDLILHKPVIYYKAMEVKETCNLHLFNKKFNKKGKILSSYCSSSAGPNLKNKINSKYKHVFSERFNGNQTTSFTLYSYM